jgi:hypothetical protein
MEDDVNHHAVRIVRNRIYGGHPPLPSISQSSAVTIAVFSCACNAELAMPLLQECAAHNGLVVIAERALTSRVGTLSGYGDDEASNRVAATLPAALMRATAKADFPSRHQFVSYVTLK